MIVEGGLLGFSGSVVLDFALVTTTDGSAEGGSWYRKQHDSQAAWKHLLSGGQPGCRWKNKKDGNEEMVKEKRE